MAAKVGVRAPTEQKRSLLQVPGLGFQVLKRPLPTKKYTVTVRTVSLFKELTERCASADSNIYVLMV